MRKLILGITILALTLGDTRADLTREQSEKIARAVGALIGQIHFRRTRLNDEMSGHFLADYLKTLDFTRMIFLQGDVDTLRNKYKEKLDNQTLQGDITAAHVIFELYLKRLKERRDYVQELAKEKFDFSKKNDRFTTDRQKASWPKTKAEAETLWRARVKFELLADRLAAKDGKFDLKASQEKIARRYDRLLRNMKASNQEEILAFYLSSMSRAYDPHSDYLSSTEAENFRINMDLKLTGIGAVLQSDDGYTKIVRIMPGGPAARSGLLKANDKIVAVQNDGDKEPVDIIEMNLNKVVQMIRGKKDTIVKLTIIPADPGDGETKKVISIKRDVVRIADQMAKAYVIETPAPKGSKAARLGVVNLPGFYQNCARDVAVLIERLKKEKVDGIVLDLRRNGGGLLDQAIALTGLFIKNGPVVQVKDSFGRKIIHRDKDDSLAYTGPLVVAVSHMSASASEIVAGALQDYGRAVVVGGGQTHGKGTVQTIMEISRAVPGLDKNSGLLKFTIRKFYRVAGTTTQKIGVTPDIRLPSVLDHMDIGERKLPRALENDEVEPADIDKLNQVNPYTAKLRENSEKRLKQDPDYKYIAEDIVRVKKQQADKSVSLNESERRKETGENKARAEARKKERATRAKSGEKVFALDLKAARANGPLKLIKVRLPDISPNENTPNSEPPDSLLMDASLRETLRILDDYRRLLPGTPAITNNN